MKVLGQLKEQHGIVLVLSVLQAVDREKGGKKGKKGKKSGKKSGKKVCCAWDI